MCIRDRYLNCAQNGTGITMQHAGGPGMQAHLVKGKDISESKAIQGVECSTEETSDTTRNGMQSS
eukprot:11971512-Alexandrium_andersonii.AAC.1